MKKTQATQESTANDGLHKRIVNSLLRRIVHSRFLQTVKKKRRFKKSFRDFMRQVEKESEARFFPSWNQTMPRLDDNTENYRLRCPLRLSHCLGRAAPG